MATATRVRSKTKSDSSGHKPPSARWAKLLRRIPGYDPIATAGDAWFEPEIAQRMLDFFPECLRHIEGEELYHQPFTLEPWQQAIVANLFGWQRLDERGRQVRRYREMLLYVPRKNGKTPMVAGLGLAVLFSDSEKGQQNYIGAGSKEQAGKLFRYAKGMVEVDQDLRSRCRIYGGNAQAGQARSIVIENENSFLRIIAADDQTEHGGTTHLAVIDELHVQGSRNLYDTLRTSLVSLNRKQPLFIQITTADFDHPSICNERYDYACKIRDGVIKNPRYLPVIYEAPKQWKGVDADYTDPAWYQHEAIWRIANPNLGVSVSLEDLRAEAEEAFNTPGYLPTFLRLHLNVRTKQASIWLNMQKWDASAGVIEAKQLRERLKGRTCYGGLDLGGTSDLTSFCLLFPNEDGSYEALWWNWVPEETAKERAKKGDTAYLDFLQRGFLETTPGNETDYTYVRERIGEIANDYGVQEIGVDRKFQGAQLCQDLAKDGFEITIMIFGPISMSAPCEELARLVNRGEMHHGGHPVARWAAGNVLIHTDSGGNIKPDKAKSADKIDPIISLIMALARAMMRPAEQGSIYETQDLVVF